MLLGSVDISICLATFLTLDVHEPHALHEPSQLCTSTKRIQELLERTQRSCQVSGKLSANLT
jgi:hypothetical protein